MQFNAIRKIKFRFQICLQTNVENQFLPYQNIESYLIRLLCIKVLYARNMSRFAYMQLLQFILVKSEERYNFMKNQIIFIEWFYYMKFCHKFDMSRLIRKVYAYLKVFLWLALKSPTPSSTTAALHCTALHLTTISFIVSLWCRS